MYYKYDFKGQRPKTKTYIIHLVLESPIICHTKGVDNAGVLVEDQIKTDKLVTVHLMFPPSLPPPASSDPLQDSVSDRKGNKTLERCATLNMLGETVSFQPQHLQFLKLVFQG